MKRIFLAFYAVIFTASFLFLSFHNAWAIPAFARKYKTSCMTCHAPFPRLTGVGEAFRLNGYKLPNNELYVKEQPVSMGAEAYKKMFPHAVWPSDIPGIPPIALLINSDINTNLHGSDNKKTTFDLPSDASLLAAGTMGDTVSFFTELAFDNADNSSEVNAWLMLQGIASSFIGDNHLNLKFGTVGDQEIGLPNARSPQRYSYTDYLYHEALDLDSHPGIELNGFGHIWRYAAGVVDNDTNQNDKDYYAAFSMKFGGVGYDGVSKNAASQGAPTSTPSGYWRDDAVHLGVFGYHGYKEVDPDSSEPYDRFGADVRVNYADWSLVAGYAYGKDKSMTFNQDHPEQNIWFGEADYYFLPWVMGYCRYESLSTTHSDNSEANYSDRDRIVPGVIFLVRANIKATVEGKFYTSDKYATTADHGTDYYDSLALAVIWAF
jgi:hypothetical protein